MFKICTIMLKIAITLLQLCTIIQSYGDSSLFSEDENYNTTSDLPAVIDMAVDYNDKVVPDYIKEALANITLSDDSVTNKYSEFLGITRLRKAIASFYSKLINRELNPENEVITTVGAAEAVFTTIKALTSVGDEWIIIEPFYPHFKSQVELANAIPRFTTLKPTNISSELRAADWHLDRDELRNLINPKTRGIIFNNPNNPLGKNYQLVDLEFIANLSEKHNMTIISDEVHEFTTDDPIIRMATVEGAFNRTMTIGSASKAFGVPGWRIGWVYGPAELIERVREVHSDVVGFPSVPAQEAVSVIIEREVKNFGSPLSYLAKNLASLKRERDFIVQAFRDAGMQPIVPEGGYCMLAGWPLLQTRKDILRGTNFADWMSTDIRVEAFNAGNYYSTQHRHLGDNQLRFCYHKSDKTLQNAAKNLLKLRNV